MSRVHFVRVDVTREDILRSEGEEVSFDPLFYAISNALHAPNALYVGAREVRFIGENGEVKTFLLPFLAQLWKAAFDIGKPVPPVRFFLKEKLSHRPQGVERCHSKL